MFRAKGPKMTEECIFCQIVSGNIPCAKLFEDDQILAFLDINPWSEGHTLVIPKLHCCCLEECPASLLGEIAQQIPALAKAILNVTQADGYNVLNNTGRSAGQLIDHVHFHIIPRKPGDGIIRHAPQGQYPPGRIDEIADEICGLLR